MGLGDCVLEIEDRCLKLRSISKTRSILLLSRPFRRAPFPETINGKQWTELLRDYSSSVESSLCGLVLANRDVRLGGEAKIPLGLQVTEVPRDSA